MSDESQPSDLTDLLLRWEELRERGQDISPDELCPESPERAARLRHEIEGLKRLRAKMYGDPAKSDEDRSPAGDEGLTLEMRLESFRWHAKGGMGAVWLARDTDLGRELAVKVIQRRCFDAANTVRFEREAETTSRLDHPGVPPLHARGKSPDGRPCYAMRYIIGQTLHDAIRRFHQIEEAGQPPPAGSETSNKRGEMTPTKDYETSAVRADSPPRKIEDPPRRTEVPPQRTENAPQRSWLELRDPNRNLAFRGLLNQFIAVCRTIDYAHARGTIHCDIKPGNVRLGEYGETIVLDWGLALGVERSEEARGLGTPWYMSPEQAAVRSDMIGPASDLYSLGATMFTILNGRAPYAGEKWTEWQERVQRGDYAVPRMLLPDVPPALEAICLKSMSLKPEDRYSSAGQLAGEIEHYLADEPAEAYREPWMARVRRWMRRHQRAVTGVVVALAVGIASLAAGLVALEGKNQELVEANGTIAQARDEARALVDDWFTSVSESKELRETPNTQPLRRKLLERAKQYYEQRVQQSAGNENPEVQAEAGRVYWRLADITRELSLGPEAAVLYEQARTIFENLTRENPSVTDFANGLAGTYINMGLLYRATGKSAEALAAFEHARNIFGKLSRENPSVTDFARGLAGTYKNLAILYRETGKLAEALMACEQARDIQEQLCLENRSATDYANDLAGTYNNLGLLSSESGKPGEALAVYEQARDILEKLSRENPSVTEFAHNLATTYNNLGNLYRATGKSAEALVVCQQARDILEKLFRENPSVPEFANRLAMTYSNLGELRGATGKLAEALEAYEQARDIQEKLTRENPIITEFANGLAMTNVNLGNLYIVTVKPAQALAAYEHARNIFGKLSRENPSVTEFANGLATSYNNLGQLYRRTGKPAEGLAAYEQARGIQEKLSRENPAVTDFASDLARTHNNLGQLYMDMIKPTEALAAYEQARDIQEKLSRENPSVTEFASELAKTYYNLGVLYSEMRKPAEALAAYEAARDIGEKLSRENPSVTDFASDLAGTYNNLSLLYIATDKPAGALAACEQARAILEKLARENPTELEYGSTLGVAWETSGVALVADHREREAVDSFRQAIDAQRAAFDAAPTVAKYRELLSNHYQGLAEAHRRLGELGEFASATLERKKLWSGKSDQLYNAACEFALCVPLVAAGKAELTPDEQAQRQKYIDLAVETLSEAIAAGYTDFEHMRIDPDLDAIRADPAYRKLDESALKDK